MQFTLLLCLSFLFVSHSFISKFPSHFVKKVGSSFNELQNSAQLEVGEVENVVFTLEENGKDNVNKYKVVGSLKPRETNAYLADYKAEIQKRGVVFPGFRAGKLPPYVMGDVRRYIVCFGIETVLRDLCNANALQICNEKGEEVMLGDDAFYEAVIQDTPSGKKFAAQRDSWKEGTDFDFTAVFWARVFEDEEEEGPVKVSDEVIDTEVVKS